MVGRVLCTTALEETWPTDRPIVFLGEWCRRYSRRERWSKLDSVVMPYHWDDREALYRDYLYLRELHERLLADLAAELCRIHNCGHGLRYWRILVGPWLGFFVQMLFDRWQSIQRATQHHDLTSTIVLSGCEESLLPLDMIHFEQLYTGDDWNHHLYAMILRGFFQVPCRELVRRSDYSEPNPVRAGSVSRLKAVLAKIYGRVAQQAVRADDALLLDTYLPIPDELRMQLRLGQVPQLWSFVTAVQTRADPRQREWVVAGGSRSEFETCARQLIPQQLPTVYLEGYKALVEQAEALPWPRRPRLIWTSSAHRSNDVFKAWAASLVEAGTPLVIGQHGGHYGMGRWCFMEEHDIRISDQYLSWGWKESQQSKVRPVGQLKVKRPLGVQHASKTRALLVTVSLPRYAYWLYSAPVAGQWLSYFADQCRFIESLPERIRSAFTVRLYSTDFGWDQAARWRDRFPGLTLDNGGARINDLIRQSRLYVSTYNATTYLESLTMDVPTVIYWDESQWELRDSARAHFAALKRAKIFHDSPESAANHVAAIWDAVEDWWSSDAVREVLRHFKQCYCDLPLDLLSKVESSLRESTHIAC